MDLDVSQFISSQICYLSKIHFSQYDNLGDSPFPFLPNNHMSVDVPSYNLLFTYVYYSAWISHI